MALQLTVLDTTVLIDLLRGHGPARDYLAGLERRLVCSEVTRTEIIQGLRSNERDAAENAFRVVRWVGVDESIARRAGALGRRWRRSHRALGLADLIIAATTQELGAQLATSNVRHFPMFSGLMTPYE
ncbi:MAG: type II toxin-antitoxin system VapC family toxin [Chloroflexota bacterium]|nr:type II toxin-antitoxin system VapC family toxin [Chloroflexota bacterium]